MEVVIGQWATYLHYDPDGVTGDPTPRDEKFERMLFGDWIINRVNERNKSAGSGSTDSSEQT